MARYLTIAYAVVAWLFVAALVVQVFLIGLALFDDPSFRETHRSFGFTVVGLAALLLLVVGILARPGRREVGLLVGIFILYIVQTSLPGLQSSYPVVAALHPVLALGLFAMGIQAARLATARVRPARGDAPAA
jgi:cytochrome b561